MCHKTSERCLLDPSNTSNPAAFEDSDCLQGSVPPYYVCLFFLITRSLILTVSNRLMYKALKTFKKRLNFPKLQAFTCQSKHLVMITRAGQVYATRFRYGFVIFFGHVSRGSLTGERSVSQTRNLGGVCRLIQSTASSNLVSSLLIEMFGRFHPRRREQRLQGYNHWGTFTWTRTAFNM